MQHPLRGSAALATTVLLAAPTLAIDNIRMSTAMLPIEPNPVAMVSIDLDADGRDELLLFYPNPARYRVFTADDRGRLVPADAVTIGHDSIGRVRVADLNADGRPDIVVYAPSKSVFHILLNQGDGTLTPSPTSPIPGISDSKFTIADVDGDGLPDIVVANTHAVSTYRNLGDATFAVPTSFSVAPTANPPDIAVADVRGTGQPSYALLNYSQLSIYHPEAPEPLYQELTLSTTGISIDALSVNPDAPPSFIIGSRTSASVMTVSHNPDTGQFSAFLSPGNSLQQSSTSYAYTRNPDRPLRAAPGFEHGGYARLMVNSPAGIGWFQQPTPVAGRYQNMYLVAFADLLGDGNEHLIYAGSNALMALSPTPQGDFTRSSIYHSHGINSHQLMPLPASTNTFLAAAPNGAAPRTITVEYVNDAPQITHEVISGIQTSSTYSRWAVADIDADGLFDLIAISTASQNNRVRSWRQLPEGGFAPHSEQFVSNLAINNLITADFNGDGFDDAAVLQSNGDAHILFGQPDGTLTPPARVPLSPFSGSGSLHAADLDGDGHIDLICANRQSSQINAAIHVAYGRPDGGFDPPVSYPAPPGAGSLTGGFIHTGDLNLNGYPDIVIGSTNASHVLLSQGHREFAAPVPVSTGGFLVGVQIVDVDGDSKPEVVTTFRYHTEIASRTSTDLFGGRSVHLHLSETAPPVFVRSSPDSPPDMLASATMGAMLIFNESAPPCPADYLPDGNIDIFDLIAFLNDLNANVPATDLNGDGRFDFFDVVIFVHAFTTLCQ